MFGNFDAIENGGFHCLSAQCIMGDSGPLSGKVLTVLLFLLIQTFFSVVQIVFLCSVFRKKLKYQCNGNIAL